MDGVDVRAGCGALRVQALQDGLGAVGRVALLDLALFWVAISGSVVFRGTRMR